MTNSRGPVCACGFENNARNLAPGTIMECFNCGAELIVGAEAPEPPVETAAESRAPAATNSDAPRSPFEDNVDEGDDVADGATRASADSAPRAPSPFEDDEPKEEEVAPSGPFTLEPAPEAGDDRFADLLESERPKHSGLENRVRTDSALDKETGETCMDCGRKIRGDWDRFRRDDGVLCYVCSNQGTHGTPERLMTKPEPRMLNENDLLIDTSPPPAPPEVAWYANSESPRFRLFVWSLALGTLMFGAYVYFFDFGPPPQETRTTAQAIQEISEMPTWARGVLQAWSILAVYLAGLSATYVALSWTNWLPHNEFKRDVFYIGVIMLGLTFMHFLALAVGNFVGQLYMFGAVMGLLLPLARLGVAAYVLSGFLDMRIKQLLLTVVLYLVFSRVLFAALGALVYQGLESIT